VNHSLSSQYKRYGLARNLISGSHFAGDDSQSGHPASARTQKLGVARIIVPSKSLFATMKIECPIDRTLFSIFRAEAAPPVTSANIFWPNRDEGIAINEFVA
jgi:hypothetical protein